MDPRLRWDDGVERQHICIRWLELVLNDQRNWHSAKQLALTLPTAEQPRAPSLSRRERERRQRRRWVRARQAAPLLPIALASRPTHSAHALPRPDRVELRRHSRRRRTSATFALPFVLSRDRVGSKSRIEGSYRSTGPARQPILRYAASTSSAATQDERCGCGCRCRCRLSLAAASARQGQGFQAAR